MHCPNCQQEVPGTAKVCGYCGHRLPVAVHCPQCGAELPPQAQVCGYCGQRLAAGSPVVPTPPPVSPPTVPQPPATTAPPPPSPSEAVPSAEARPALRRRIRPWGWIAGGLVILLLLITVIGGSLLSSRSRNRATQTAQQATNATATAQARQEANATATATSIPPTDTPVIPTSTPVPIPEGPFTNASLGDTWIRPADDMVMVYVPGGTFQMGSGNSDPNAGKSEKPQHEVSLDNFWIDKTEVTVAQFRTFIQDTKYKTTAEKEGWGSVYAINTDEWRRIDGANWLFPNGSVSPAQDSYPVVQVTWEDAAAYCEWAGGQLPAEAQWEYAARGSSGLTYPWGNTFDSSLANTSENDKYKQTAPVGNFPAGKSWVGALDMAGNVGEWIDDWYEGYPGTQAESDHFGTTKVLRGGAWDPGGNDVRAAARYWGLTDARLNTVGFRCVVLISE